MGKRRQIIWYHPDLKEQARELRSNCTYTEKLLWAALKGKQLKGYDFHRQKPLAHYIVDFFCHELMLAIEIDGSIHDLEDNRVRDTIRQAAIEEYGVRFLRFTDDDVRHELNKVVESILDWISWYERDILDKK